MGGLNPPSTSLSQACIPPPQRGGCLVHRDPGNHLPLVALGTTPKGAKPSRATLRGCFPSSPPPDGPPNLGIARICWEYSLVASLPIFTDLYRLSWEIILSHSRVSFTVDYLFTCMFFFSGIVLRRNHLINRVELFEESSILLLLRCLEAC